jgi:hypothetical protein
MSQESETSVGVAMSGLVMEAEQPLRTDEDLRAAAAALAREIDEAKAAEASAEAGSGKEAGSGVAGVADDAGVDGMDDGMDYSMDDDAAVSLADDEGAAGGDVNEAEKEKDAAPAVDIAGQDGCDDDERETVVGAGDAAAAAAGVAAGVAADGDATGVAADGVASGEATGAGVTPPPVSRHLSVYELSEEEEEEEEEEEQSDFEEDELIKKSQQELEKMLVSIKTDIAILQEKSNQTGKQVLKDLLREESISKEQQTKINSVFVKMKALTDEEQLSFQMVVDAEIASKQVPAEMAKLAVKVSRIEDVLEEKVEEAARKRKAKVSARVEAKVSARKSPSAKRRKS